jgi:tubulin gamma
MLANHTSIASVGKPKSAQCRRTHARVNFAQLFKRMLDQFDRLKKRNAFLEQYKKERVFENGLEEFDDARYGSYCAPQLTALIDPRHC